jgi:hypothetical protein
MAGASGLLESKNDELIEQLLKDPLFKITAEGKIFSKLTLNGQGISDDWREVGYQKEDGYVRFRYKDNFLFAQRVVYRARKGELKSDHVINHIDLDNSNNHPDNLEQIIQHENNKKKHKKYKKHKKKASIERILEEYLKL